MKALLLFLAQDGAPQIFDFETVDTVQVADLKGDGRPSLVVQTGLDLQFFSQTASGRFRETPDRVMRFDSRTFLWMLKRNGAGRWVLLTMSDRGIHSRSLEGDRLEDLVVHPTVFETRSLSGAAPLYFDFAPDFTGKGLPCLVLFGPDRLYLLVREDGAWTLRDKVDCGFETGGVPWSLPYAPISASTIVPMFAFGDVNGDGRPDLLWYKDEELTILLQQPDGRFRKTRAITLSEVRHHLRRNIVRLEVPPVLEDFTGDGLVDVAFTEGNKGRVYLRYGIRGRDDFSEPDLREMPDAWNLATQFVSLEGKGPKKMVLWMIPELGLASGIKAFVTKQVGAEIYFFDSTGEGRPTKSLRTKIALSIPYTLTLTREMSSFPVELLYDSNFEGDVNGDGVKDLLIAVGDTLYVRYGDRQKIVRAEPDAVVRLHPPTPTSRARLVVRNLTGGPKDDVIVVFNDSVLGRGRIEILR